MKELFACGIGLGVMFILNVLATALPFLLVIGFAYWLFF